MIQMHELQKEIVRRNFNRNFRILLNRREFSTILDFIASGARMTEIQSFLFIKTVLADSKKHVISFNLNGQPIKKFSIKVNTSIFTENFIRHGIWPFETLNQ